LDSRGKAEGNNRRAREIPLKPAINHAEDFGRVINLRTPCYDESRRDGNLAVS
jgi:hypothetical protein